MTACTTYDFCIDGVGVVVQSRCGNCSSCGDGWLNFGEACDDGRVCVDCAEPPSCGAGGTCPPGSAPCASAVCVDGACVAYALPFGSACSLKSGHNGTCNNHSVCMPIDTVDGIGDCTEDADCELALPCIVGLCIDYACVYHNRTDSPCDDGLWCTVNDRCVDGLCVGLERSCDDGVPCTIDTCSEDSSSCVFTASTAHCDDGDACTHTDMCDGFGACVGLTKNCSDDNVCTTDVCVSGVCLHSAVGGDCDDGDACTIGDRCHFGECSGDPLSCSATAAAAAANPCSVSVCVDGACVLEDTTSPCHLVCMAESVCRNGSCVGVTPVVCIDDNPCHRGSYCRFDRCYFSLVDCEDGDLCTHNRCVPSRTGAGFRCISTPSPEATGCVSSENSIDNQAASGDALASSGVDAASTVGFVSLATSLTAIGLIVLVFVLFHRLRKSIRANHNTHMRLSDDGDSSVALEIVDASGQPSSLRVADTQNSFGSFEDVSLDV